MSKTIQVYSAFLIFLGSVFGLQAQTHVLNGTVVDRHSQKGIEGVVISTADGMSYTLTNDEGNFELTIDNQVESLWFSQMNYHVKEVSTTTARLIELDLINKNLEEIVLFAKPLAIVFSSALQKANNFVEKGDVYRTYSREFNMVNETLSNVADGLVDYYIEKPTKTPKIEVKQNRVFYSPKGREDVGLEEIMNTMGEGDIRTFLTDENNIEKVKNILEQQDTYDFVTRKKIGIKGEETIVVEFAPKENLKGWKYYEGYVVFTADQHYLLEYKMGLSKPYEKNRKVHNFLIAKAYINDFVWQGVYHRQGDQYFLFYKSAQSDIELIRKKWGTNRINRLREVQVNQIEKNVAIPPIDKLRRMSLFSLESHYQTEFWKNQNSRLLSKSEEAILRALEERSQQ